MHIKKGKSLRFLALKIWALVVLKFFDVVLKFELPRARCLNFPKNSASVLIRLVLIIRDCDFNLFTYSSREESPWETPLSITKTKKIMLKRNRLIFLGSFFLHGILSCKFSAYNTNLRTLYTDLIIWQLQCMYKTSLMEN